MLTVSRKLILQKEGKTMRNFVKKYIKLQQFHDFFLAFFRIFSFAKQIKAIFSKKAKIFALFFHFRNAKKIRNFWQENNFSISLETPPAYKTKSSSWLSNYLALWSSMANVCTHDHNRFLEDVRSRYWSQHMIYST